MARNGGGAVLNVLSVLSWYHPAGLGGYSAAKAAPARSPRRYSTASRPGLPEILADDLTRGVKASLAG